MTKLHLDLKGSPACGGAGTRLTTEMLTTNCKGCQKYALRTAVNRLEAVEGAVGKPEEQLASELLAAKQVLSMATATTEKLRRTLWRLAVGVRAPQQYARAALDSVDNALNYLEAGGPK